MICCWPGNGAEVLVIEIYFIVDYSNYWENNIIRSHLRHSN